MLSAQIAEVCKWWLLIVALRLAPSQDALTRRQYRSLLVMMRRTFSPLPELQPGAKTEKVS